MFKLYLQLKACSYFAFPGKADGKDVGCFLDNLIVHWSSAYTILQLILREIAVFKFQFRLDFWTVESKHYGKSRALNFADTNSLHHPKGLRSKGTGMMVNPLQTLGKAGMDEKTSSPWTAAGMLLCRRPEKAVFNVHACHEG